MLENKEQLAHEKIPSKEKYSLVPKERHVRKESNGGTLGLCVVPKESHDCILVK